MGPKLIVALDVNTMSQAKDLVRELSPVVQFFKIGSQLFTAYGPKVVEMVGKRGGKVFLDLKFNDIPNTVRNACYIGTGTGSFAQLFSYVTRLFKLDQKVKEVTRYPVFMITVHASATIETLQSAIKGAAERAAELHIDRPLVIGVTVLTNENLGENTLKVVLERASKAKKAGLDGVVCSVSETEVLRKEFGNDFVIVNPGIRPVGADKADQKRTATPADAKKSGASFIVVGRPILEAEDHRKAAEDILKELS